ncbi:DUF1016 N-terminal domain-containing protein [Bengtsoniella intestinalis]|uniref:DUF1016 N-terminal domain-containing protein n=1 Tax=Bengtsoniella intestinalis TaxID=3073143 RepID=UPI00391FBA71
MKQLKVESSQFIAQILDSIQACYGQAEPTNSQLMALYGEIGKVIEQQGEKAFVAFMANEIETAFPHVKGFSLRNLRRMRDYYKTYKNSPDLMTKAQGLNWTQNAVVLECCQCNEERAFYISLAMKEKLSKLALIRAIEANTFEREKADATVSPKIAPVSHVWQTPAPNTTVTQQSHVARREEQPCPLHQGRGIVSAIRNYYRRRLIVFDSSIESILRKFQLKKFYLVLCNHFSFLP